MTMQYRNWKDITEFVGIVAIVASLIFVGMQMRQDQVIAVSEALGESVNAESNARLGFSQYADIVVKSNNRGDLNDVELFVLRNLIATEVDRVFIQSQRAAALSQSNVSHELRLSAFLHGNPGLRAEFEQYDDEIKMYVDPLRSAGSLDITYKVGSGAFRQRIRDNLARLDELSR